MGLGVRYGKRSKSMLCTCVLRCASAVWVHCVSPDLKRQCAKLRLQNQCQDSKGIELLQLWRGACRGPWHVRWRALGLTVCTGSQRK